MSQYHTPVLLEESVGLLAVEPAGTYADLTFGGGGHSRRILSDLGPEGRLYGFDQDRDTLENRPDDARFHYVESNFRFLRGALRLRGVREVDGILAEGIPQELLLYIAIGLIVVMDGFMKVSESTFNIASTTALVITAGFMVYTFIRYFGVFREILRSTDGKYDLNLPEEMRAKKERTPKN